MTHLITKNKRAGRRVDRRGRWEEIMKPIDLKLDSTEGHKCEIKIKDGWVIFTCPKCPSYERRQNTLTGAMIVRGANKYRHYFIGGIYPEPKEMN